MSLLLPPDSLRNSLPLTLFPAKSVRIIEYNPLEVQKFANKPRVTRSPPAWMSERTKSLVMRFPHMNPNATPEELARSYGNRYRVVKRMVNDEEVTLPAEMPRPTIPVGSPPVKVISAIKARYLKTVLSREEWDLYMLTWKEWFEGHPDYVSPEDQADVATVCMETVIQFRLQLTKLRYPTRDIDLAYNQSFRRFQQARENLTARRADTMNRKGNTSIGTINVAVMAGQIDERRIMELQQQARQQQLTDMDVLDGTLNSEKQIANRLLLENQATEIIEAEVMDAPKEQK